MTFVLLSLGSNIGKSRQTIQEAFKLLKDSGVIKHARLSSFYKTEPVGYKDQPWFVNAAITGYTDHNAFSLLQMCKSIEYSLGRQERERWHEREIDIDILLYGDEKIDIEGLGVPHAALRERKFVLTPAAEIAGFAIDPISGFSIKELLEDCDDRSAVKLA